MKRFFIIIFSLLFFAIHSFAQDCYSDNRSQGVAAYNNGKYAEAKKYFQSAQNCDMKPRQNDVADWIGKCDEKLKTAVVQGALNGVFSVSPTQKVVFSKGNLQYRASTNTWRFAEHQYDIIVIDEANKNISSTYNGWIDLFGWGTSGYNGRKPYLNPEELLILKESISKTNYDLGVYNAISNGGNTKGLWRTLTYSEWNYLIHLRNNASKKWGTAYINGVGVWGVIVLPDNWNSPHGVSFISGTAIHKYSIQEWIMMEKNGAIFLPDLYYWSGTVGNAGYAGALRAWSTNVDVCFPDITGSYSKYYVRLVKNVN